MAVSHVKSDTIAGWTGTVTVFDSQGSTASVAATDLMRPTDWNSAHNEYFTLTGNTTGNSTASGENVVFAASGGVLIGGSTASVILSVPVLSAFQPFPLITGSSAESSHAPASWWFNKISLPAPVTISNLFFLNSASIVGFDGARSLSYSKGVTIFKRQDFGANSTNLTTVTTASFGLSFSINTAGGGSTQGVSWRWVTNTTGGTSSTSGGGSNTSAISTVFSGRKFFPMPLVASLSEGEYFVAHAHSTTTGGGVFLSFSQFHIAPQVITVGSFGSAGSRAMSGAWEMGEGVASAVTTNNTMAMSVISQATRHRIYFHMANHATI